MNFTFRNKRVSGLLTVVPRHVAYFEDEVANYAFPPKSSLKLQKMFGLKSHRYLTDESVTGSDLALHGIRHLLEAGTVRPE